MLDLVFDNAVVPKQVNLRKITYNNRVMMYRAVGIVLTCIRAETSLAHLGFEAMNQRVSRCPSTKGNVLLSMMHVRHFCHKQNCHTYADCYAQGPTDIDRQFTIIKSYSTSIKLDGSSYDYKE